MTFSRSAGDATPPVQLDRSPKLEKAKSLARFSNFSPQYERSVESVNDIAGLYTAYRAQIQLKSSGLISTIAARSRSIGAICESSRWLAQRMYNAMSSPSADSIVELGAGYGSVTQLLPETAISIEREKNRYDYLCESFPNRSILDCCAINFLPSLETPAVIFSSIPSINNPEFSRLRATVTQSRQRGMVAELITYTYFPTNNPFSGIFSVEERTGLEVRNMPPAFVWRYKC